MKPFKRLKKPDENSTQEYREKYKEAPFAVKFMVRGTNHLWSTRTNDIQLAKRRGQEYRQRIISEEFDLVDRMKAHSDVPQFAALFKLYLELPLRSAKRARRRAVSAMEQVLQTIDGNDKSPLSVLSAKLALTYQQRCLADKQNPVTINARLRFARSLFSRAAMVGYKAYGMELKAEGVKDFCSVGALHEPERLPEIPSGDVLAAAHTALEPFPDVFRAFLLAAYAGLRSCELKAARWDWIDNGVIYVGGREYVAKSRKWRPIRLAPEVMRKIEQGERTEPFICGICPPMTVGRKLPGMLKDIGFTSDHPVHSLRRLFGSNVAAVGGLWAAQGALGHSSPSTTAKHYARQLNLAPAVGMAPLTPVAPAAAKQ